MHLCYVDEAGDPGRLPSPTHDIAPVFIVAGVVIPQVQLHGLTTDLLTLKYRFNPNALGPRAKYLDFCKVEIKGSALRARLRSGSRRKWRHAYGYLDRFMDILETREARIFARIWIKKIGEPINGKSLQTFSMQAMCENFEALLARKNDEGFMIADSQDPSSNANTAHSIFTQKFRTAGDK